MSRAYVIAEVDVTDPQAYEQYKVLSTQAIAAAGGEVLVRGGAVHPVEGGWNPPRVVVIAFGSLAQARQFYDSALYRQAREARSQAARMRLIIAEGVPA